MIAYHSSGIPQPQPPPRYSDQHKANIIGTLRRLGANRYDLLLPETHSLPNLVQPTETIEGVLYGRYHLSTGQPPGRGVIAATNKRLLFIDHKPLFMRAAEVAYDAVSAVTSSRVGPMGYVTINTRMGDITVRTFNQHCATTFVQAIESHIFNRRYMA